MFNIDIGKVITTSIIGGLAWFIFSKMVNLDKVKEAVDITSSKNLANTLAEDVYKEVTGSTQSIGADVYDRIHSIGDIPEDEVNAIVYAVENFGVDSAVKLLPKQGISAEKVFVVMKAKGM